LKVLYYDVFCGISGDMNLGALVDLGVDFNYLKSELKKLNIDEEFEVVTRRDMKHGISGTKVDVILHNQKDYKHTQEDDHKHTHEGDHKHTQEADHKHTQEDDHKHAHEADHNHHDHRNYATIKAMIEKSNLNKSVKTISIEIFRLVAVAEGKVHDKPMEEVHFHEVGATDSIVDIVGAAICLDALNVDRVMASSVQVGGGFVKCAHGRMPVPAPATAEILVNVPLKYNVVPFETTTPTGAAILKATVEEFNDNADFVIEKVGYGLGNKDFEIPNVLRVYLGHMNEENSDLEVEEQYVMETNLDDMTPEIFGFVEDKLFEFGALDVFKTPIIMKKGRSAVKLSVLFKDKERQKLQEIIFTETTSAGIRETKVTKYMLKRDFQTLTTIYGDVQIKTLYLNGERVKSKPEYEDCVTLAKINKVTIREIYEAVNNGKI